MCGLYGIVNKHKRKFDLPTFLVLGTANDSRGGDSCGIFIDGETEYGTGINKKYFTNFWETSELLKNTEECLIALGHDRKASVGAITEENAQPVVLKSKTGEVKYVLIHNGTIYNYEDLAKKYIPDVKIDGMTDSQVLARIFYYKGYDCLAEYNGGAAFVAVDYRQPEPQVFFWKGSSKKSQYVTTDKPEEERPLYFIETPDGVVFSSISKYLQACMPKETLYTFTDNSLITIGTDGKLAVVKSYDRSKCQQTKIYTTSYNYDEYYGRSWKGGGATATHTPASTTKKTEASISKDYLAATDGLIFNYPQENVYRRKGSPIHGRVIIDNHGNILKDSKGKNARVLWFFQGIALDLENGRANFRFLNYLQKKSGLDDKAFYEKFQMTIRFLSFDRILLKNEMCFIANGPLEGDCTPFSGLFQSIGTTYGSCYKDGKKVTYGEEGYISTASNIEAPFTYYEKRNTEETRIKIDYSNVRELCISQMNGQAN